MATDVRVEKKDEIVDEIASCLAVYERDHPRANVKVYRLDPHSVRIRVIDPSFVGIGRVARHESVWSYLGGLSEQAQSGISMLLLLTPEEERDSSANWEFEHPEEFDRS